MSQYMLDTDICIYLINKKPDFVLQRFRQEALTEWQNMQVGCQSGLNPLFVNIT